jgi:uncharacterized protein YjeT (DUF2065 family)
MVMIVEGLPYFASPSRMKAWIAKFAEMSDGTLRVTGFVLMMIGLVLVYLGRG